MSELVEAGLRRVLAEPSRFNTASAELPPLPSWNGGENSSTFLTEMRSTG